MARRTFESQESGGYFGRSEWVTHTVFPTRKAALESAEITRRSTREPVRVVSNGRGSYSVQVKSRQ